MPNTWREVSAVWRGENAFIGKNSAGATVEIGTFQGKPGVGPMEMLLLGAAGCTGMDIVSILEKKRQPLENLEVRVRGLRADTYPMVYTQIHLTYLVWGDGIDPRALEQAIELSEEKYCSASIMLAATASVTSSYRILAPGEEFHEENVTASGD